MNREKEIKDFVQGALGNYGVLTHEVKLNDDSDESYTDFEIVIKNTTNQKQAIEVLRCHDYEGGIEILKGEDFYSTDAMDFITCLFLGQFLTYEER